MTHAERRNRREKIAARVRENGSTWEAARSACVEFGVSDTTVADACRQFGVAVPRKLCTTGRDVFRIVADLLLTDATMSEIGRKYGVSYQYVQQVYSRCRGAGVPVRERFRCGRR